MKKEIVFTSEDKEKIEKKEINLKDIFDSKGFIIVAVSIASFIMLLLVFRLGVIVGFEKAKFSYKWSDNYYKNFDGPREPGFMGGFGGGPDMGFMNAHGTFGQIIKIDTDTLVIKDKDGVEKIVSVKSDTSIKEFRNDIKISNLKVNSDVVIIGEPDSTGQIEAKLIRVMPERPQRIDSYGQNK